jgi:hypothetical protein
MEIFDHKFEAEQAKHCDTTEVMREHTAITTSKRTKLFFSGARR